MSLNTSYIIRRLVVLAGIFLVIVAAPNQAQADPSKYPEFAQQSLPANIKLELIKVDELVAEIKAGAKPLIVDVRTGEEFHEAHILSAVSAPFAEFKDYLKSMPRDRLIVLYCACPHHLSSLAYGILYENGYRNMKVLDEGLVGWQEKRYPLEGTKVPK